MTQNDPPSQKPKIKTIQVEALLFSVGEQNIKRSWKLILLTSYLKTTSKKRVKIKVKAKVIPRDLGEGLVNGTYLIFETSGYWFYGVLFWQEGHFTSWAGGCCCVARGVIAFLKLLTFDPVDRGILCKCHKRLQSSVLKALRYCSYAHQLEML